MPASSTSVVSGPEGSLTLRDLELIAVEVLRLIKKVPEAQGEAKIAVIGGLALWHYLPHGRPTDVSFSFALLSCTPPPPYTCALYYSSTSSRASASP